MIFEAAHLIGVKSLPVLLVFLTGCSCSGKHMNHLRGLTIYCNSLLNVFELFELFEIFSSLQFLYYLNYLDYLYYLSQTLSPLHPPLRLAQPSALQGGWLK